jgi:hypothetical protein
MVRVDGVVHVTGVLLEMLHCHPDLSPAAAAAAAADCWPRRRCDRRVLAVSPMLLSSAEDRPYRTTHLAYYCVAALYALVANQEPVIGLV